jgi:hypothetical protein
MKTGDRRQKTEHKNRQFTQTERDCYKLGYLNAQQAVKKTLIQFAKANRLLYDELTRLDRIMPQAEAAVVSLNQQQWKCLIRNIKKYKDGTLLQTLRKWKRNQTTILAGRE